MEAAILEDRVVRASKLISKVRGEMARRVIGQAGLVDGMLMGIIAGGHVLVEGVPGLAKTLAVRTLSEVIDADFKRIQFTPDLLPADLVGNMVYRPQTSDFVARKGPVFTNIVLADEINRAPAKVQSALLESMEERQVTIGDQTYELPRPFFVMATQNPIEQEGTYPLPEAQLDRFLLKLKVGYPDADQELAILQKMGVKTEHEVSRVLSVGDIEYLRETADQVLVDDRISRYIVSIVTATRDADRIGSATAKFLEFGASPRATLAMFRCAKIRALYEGRTFVIPDDVKTVAYETLRHRLVLSYEAESEELTADDVIRKILKGLPVP